MYGAQRRLCSCADAPFLCKQAASASVLDCKGANTLTKTKECKSRTNTSKVEQQQQQEPGSSNTQSVTQPCAQSVPPAQALRHVTHGIHQRGAQHALCQCQHARMLRLMLLTLPPRRNSAPSTSRQPRPSRPAARTISCRQPPAQVADEGHGSLPAATGVGLRLQGRFHLV